MNYQHVLLLLISTFITTGIYNLHQEGTNSTPLQAAEDSFEAFKNTHLLSFENPQEEMYRISVFHENAKYIRQMNAQQDNFSLELNKFATLTKEEFKQLYLGNSKPTPTPKDSNIVVSKGEFPKSWTWKGKGAMTSVSDEGKCDASYAFSSIGALEAMYVRKKSGPLTKFSAQDVVSCNNFGGGCQGGSVEKTLNWIMEQGKVYTEASYPFSSQDGTIAPCSVNKQEVENFGFVAFTNDSPKEDVELVLQNRIILNPVSSGIDGHNLQFYKGGIFDNCGQDRNIDMLVYGYTQEYWEIKTPFGTNWGEQGFMRLKMGNTCGVAVQFFTPVY